MVEIADTVVDPRTVVVHVDNTPSALVTMMYIRRQCGNTSVAFTTENVIYRVTSDIFRWKINSLFHFFTDHVLEVGFLIIFLFAGSIFYDFLRFICWEFFYTAFPHFLLNDLFVEEQLTEINYCVIVARNWQEFFYYAVFT